MKEYFESIQDPRQKAKVKHNILEIIVMVACAVIADCDVWEDIADFCRVKENWLRESLGLELKNGIPSHDTLSRVFGMIEPEEFNTCFTNWVKSICNSPKQVISIDGKTLCGSKDTNKSPLHMVSAWASEARLVLGQIATEEKSNEITAVPELLKTLDIEGSTITADAMSCQKAIVKDITDRRADYVIGLKRNQPNMYEDAELYFTNELKRLPKHDTSEKGHGRIEFRHYYLCTDKELLALHDDWTNLNGIGMMKSRVIKGDTITEETHYYITSLTDVESFADAVRKHWAVETSLHWCLDVTFREDHSRIRKDHSAQNMAVVRHIALNALKSMNDKMSLARRRRHCSYDDAYLANVIFSLFSIHA